MASLRKVYEEQTEKAKHEFMYLHSAKVGSVVLRLSWSPADAVLLFSCRSYRRPSVRSGAAHCPAELS